MVATAIGGIAWVFIYPMLSGERQAERRRASVAKAGPIARTERVQQKSRREQVEDTLNELDFKSKRPNSPPLTTRITQAGLSWSKNQFFMASAGLGLFAFAALFIFSGSLIAALVLGCATALGPPRWILHFLKIRRQKLFLNGFPDAVDVIVRGIKSGLPLLDNMKIISAEAPEPVRSEFRAIIETQAVGMPLGEACVKLYDRMPLAEANFFGIVISIQQKASGNLSEALGNLSRVLRERKKMKAKIQAMSMEAKASGAIIGSLPIVVGLLVYLTSPNYIELLWTTELGKVMIAGCAVWMSIGIFVMKKMINFDF